MRDTLKGFRYYLRSMDMALDVESGNEEKEPQQ